MSHVKNVFVTFAVVMLLATFSSCTQIKAGLESPLPPPETLQLQADVMDSSNIGGKMVHFSWTPPDESSNIDLVVIEKAENDGLEVVSNIEATKESDIIMFALPDTVQSSVYKEEVEPNLSEGKTIMFAHGFTIFYKQIIH